MGSAPPNPTLIESEKKIDIQQVSVLYTDDVMIFRLPVGAGKCT